MTYSREISIMFCTIMLVFARRLGSTITEPSGTHEGRKNVLNKI